MSADGFVQKAEESIGMRMLKVTVLLFLVGGLIAACSSPQGPTAFTQDGRIEYRSNKCSYALATTSQLSQQARTCQAQGR
ncbi:MAG: hypothetical protein P8Q36_08350 [Alphaproteobacteria bacterium]|jgi:hypothetical protein|nr:hypothetical protein [Rhodospirillaceae bacterium]MBT6206088.1 hypothetical protein [Rhodospirillaceae bacterium]MBT6509757.1 hypothetical protein [Rhodospirillaceae bacterium]MBT7648208.1 hypothetical protein [Rhodospirillaceae bacterium]MDG2480865.1 hypothetical protein [Alphaproteobacteria bacterium]